MRIDQESRTILISTAIGIALLALATWQVGRLRPPNSFRLATGPEGTHSHRTALSYVDAINNRGFQVEIVPTRGPGQTIEMLQSKEVDAGFLENTSGLQQDLSGIEALTAVYPEPLWIFYRSEQESSEPFDALSDLSGRIGIGEVNSASNQLARLLFQLSEVDPEQVEYVALPDESAASQLLSGALDAAIIAGGIESDPVLDLLLSPDIELLNLRRIKALTILVPFLSPIMLPEGTVRLSENRPDEDKNLLATKAVLSVRSDLHPDIQRLLLTVAEQQHQRMSWFESPGEYPTRDGIMFDVSPVAIEFGEGGPSYLERYLPFWIASPLERFYLLILPTLFLLYPLVRTSPSVYQGVMRRRINRWYGTIREAELELYEYSLDELDEKISELNDLNRQLAQTISVPSGYMERYYSLRIHIRLVMDDLRERREMLRTESRSKDRAEV